MIRIIFFHGGAGPEDFDADAKLVASLRTKLEAKCEIDFPRLPKEDAPDFGRRKQIVERILSAPENVILVAHSLGASMLLACLSENTITKKIAGIFLMATPFWKGDEDWVKPLKLQRDFASKLDKDLPLYFYHCRDDEEVPFAHLNTYRKEIPWASFHEIPSGGHQLNNDLTPVANDIKSL